MARVLIPRAHVDDIGLPWLRDAYRAHIDALRQVGGIPAGMQRPIPAPGFPGCPIVPADRHPHLLEILAAFERGAHLAAWSLDENHVEVWVEEAPETVTLQP